MLHALIFDLDGTLINTDPLHFRSYRDLLAECGISIDEDFYHATMSGRPNMDIMRDLLPDLSDGERRGLAARKEACFRELATALEPLPGLHELLDWAEEEGLRQALVTSAPRENARYMLAVLGLEGHFPVTVLADELPRGKPDPLPYLTALERLGLTGSEALVFEDAPAGVRSAAGAGIPTIGMATTPSSAWSCSMNERRKRCRARPIALAVSVYNRS